MPLAAGFLPPAETRAGEALGVALYPVDGQGLDVSISDRREDDHDGVLPSRTLQP